MQCRMIRFFTQRRFLVQVMTEVNVIRLGLKLKVRGAVVRVGKKGLVKKGRITGVIFLKKERIRGFIVFRKGERIVSFTVFETEGQMVKM